MAKKEPRSRRIQQWEIALYYRTPELPPVAPGPVNQTRCMGPGVVCRITSNKRSGWVWPWPKSPVSEVGRTGRRKTKESSKMWTKHPS